MHAPTWQMARLFGGLASIAFGLLYLPSEVLAGSAQENCNTHVLAAERKLNIPNGLLLSIALVESGYEGEARPFTMTFGSRTHYARTHKEAARQLRDNKGRLRHNAFVGCMQLSLKYHSSHFQPVENIVDPKSNVWYAGRYLVRLHSQKGSWRTAVAMYNGGSHSQAEAYLCRVWNRLVQLDRSSAALLKAENCGPARHVEIAPITRRAFRQAQVASNPEPELMGSGADAE